MKLITIGKAKTSQLFYVAGGILAVIMLMTAKQDDPSIVAASMLLALVSIYPLYFWLIGASQGLPIWPIFAAATGVLAALPMIQDQRNLTQYTSAEVIVGGMTVAGFILLGTAIWLSMTARAPKPPKTLLMISRRHSERYLFSFVVLGLLYYVNELGGFVYLPGNTMQIVRGIAGSLGAMGIFVLAFYDGRGLLSRAQSVLLMILTAMTALAAASGLILATAIVPVAMLLLGYTLGGAKLPWKSLATVLCIAAILHPGKFAMRDLYWGEQRRGVSLDSLPAFYSDWFGYGFQQVGAMVGLSSNLSSDEIESSLFERSGTLHMLLLVQKKSPSEVPFLNGLTYEPIPRLLIPRFLDQEKGISHAGNVLLTVNYGVQTLEQTQSTSVGWGLIPEAYANFGYLGVAGLAILLAIAYSALTKLTVGVPMTSLRFVLGLLVMAAATKADTMGVFITSQFQGIAGVSLAALVLMRRQGNPFVEESGSWSSDQFAHHMTSGGKRERNSRGNAMEAGAGERGIPAPGVLATLIEGEQLSPDIKIHEPSARAKWGGQKPPRWAPLSHRLEYAKRARAAEQGENEASNRSVVANNDSKQQTKRPRQVAVPIQPYYYRSRKA